MSSDAMEDLHMPAGAYEDLLRQLCGGEEIPWSSSRPQVASHGGTTDGSKSPVLQSTYRQLGHLAKAAAAAVPFGVGHAPGTGTGRSISRSRLQVLTEAGAEVARAEDGLSAEGKVNTEALVAAVVRALAAQGVAVGPPPAVHGSTVQRGSHHGRQPEEPPLDDMHLLPPPASLPMGETVDVGLRSSLRTSHIPALNPMLNSTPVPQLKKKQQGQAPAQQSRSYVQLQLPELQLLHPEEAGAAVVIRSDGALDIGGRRGGNGMDAPSTRPLWPCGSATALAAAANEPVRTCSVEQGWQQRQQRQQRQQPKAAPGGPSVEVRLSRSSMAVPAEVMVPYAAAPKEPSARRDAQMLAQHAAAAAEPVEYPVTVALLIPRAFVSRGIPDARPGDQIPVILTVDDGSRGEGMHRGAGISASQAAAKAAAASGHYPAALVVQRDGSGVLADPLISEAIAAYQAWTTLDWHVEQLDGGLSGVYWVEWRVVRKMPTPQLRSMVAAVPPPPIDVTAGAGAAEDEEAALLHALDVLIRQQGAVQEQLARMQARRAVQQQQQRLLSLLRRQQQQQQQPVDWDEREEENEVQEQGPPHRQGQQNGAPLLVLQQLERRAGAAAPAQPVNLAHAGFRKSPAPSTSDFADALDGATPGAGRAADAYGTGLEGCGTDDVSGARRRADLASLGGIVSPGLAATRGASRGATAVGDGVPSARRNTGVQDGVVAPSEVALPQKEPSPSQPLPEQLLQPQVKAEPDGSPAPLVGVVVAASATSCSGIGNPEEPSGPCFPSLKVPKVHLQPRLLAAAAAATAAEPASSSPPPLLRMGNGGAPNSGGAVVEVDAAAAAAADGEGQNQSMADCTETKVEAAKAGGASGGVAEAEAAAVSDGLVQIPVVASAAGGGGGTTTASSELVADPVVARSAPRSMSRYLTSGEIRVLFTDRDSQVLCNPPCGLLLTMQMFLDGQPLGPPQEAQLCRYNSSSPRYLTSVPAQELASPPIPWKRLAGTTIHFRRCRSGLLQLWATRNRPADGGDGGGSGKGEGGDVLPLAAKDSAAMPKLVSFKPAGLRRAAWLASSGGPPAAAAASGEGDDDDDGDGDGDNDGGALPQPLQPQRLGSWEAGVASESEPRAPMGRSENDGARDPGAAAAAQSTRNGFGRTAVSRRGSGTPAAAGGSGGVLENSRASAFLSATGVVQGEVASLDPLPGPNGLPDGLNDLNRCLNYPTLPGELRTVDRGGAPAARQRALADGSDGEVQEPTYCTEVLVACPPRSLSRYVTKAELELLVGPDVYEQLCAGNKLADVRVMFEVDGRRLPEVFMADIERYNSSSPFYLKASSGRGVDGLPWRSVPANATVQWRRMADNTLVLVQVSKSGRRDSSGRDAVPARPSSYQHSEARYSAGDVSASGRGIRRRRRRGGECSRRSWSTEEDTSSEDDTSDDIYGSGGSGNDAGAALKRRQRQRRRAAPVWDSTQDDGAAGYMLLQALAGAAGRALQEEAAAAEEAEVKAGEEDEIEEAEEGQMQKRCRTVPEPAHHYQEARKAATAVCTDHSLSPSNAFGRGGLGAGGGGGLGMLVCPSQLPQQLQQHSEGSRGTSSFISRIVATNLYIGRRQLQALYGPGFKSDTKSDMQLSLNGTLMPELYHVQWKEGCHKGSFYPKGAPLGQLRGRFLQGIYWLDEARNLLVAVAWDQPPADWSLRRLRTNSGSLSSSGAATKPARWLWQRQAERARNASAKTGPDAAAAVATAGFAEDACVGLGRLQRTGDRRGSGGSGREPQRDAATPGEVCRPNSGPCANRSVAVSDGREHTTAAACGGTAAMEDDDREGDVAVEAAEAVTVADQHQGAFAAAGGPSLETDIAPVVSGCDSLRPGVEQQLEWGSGHKGSDERPAVLSLAVDAAGEANAEGRPGPGGGNPPRNSWDSSTTENIGHEASGDPSPCAVNSPKHLATQSHPQHQQQASAQQPASAPCECECAAEAKAAVLMADAEVADAGAAGGHSASAASGSGGGVSGCLKRCREAPVPLECLSAVTGEDEPGAQVAAKKPRELGLGDIGVACKQQQLLLPQARRQPQQAQDDGVLLSNEQLPQPPPPPQQQFDLAAAGRISDTGDGCFRRQRSWTGCTVASTATFPGCGSIGMVFGIPGTSGERDCSTDNCPETGDSQEKQSYSQDERCDVEADGQNRIGGPQLTTALAPRIAAMRRPCPQPEDGNGGDNTAAAATVPGGVAGVSTTTICDATEGDADCSEVTDELVIRTIPWISMHLARKWYPEVLFAPDQPPYPVEVAIEVDGHLQSERYPAQLKSYPFNNSVFLPGLPVKLVKGMIRTGWRKLKDQTLVLIVRSPVQSGGTRAGGEEEAISAA